MNQERTETLPFRPRARLLRLLGDELIRDPNIAIFELVKNSYDADATYSQVSMLHVSDPNTGRIVVEDDGTGMNWETITKVWMEPGTDFRLRQRESNAARSPKYGRLPMGEKGVGRFSLRQTWRCYYPCHPSPRPAGDCFTHRLGAVT